MKSTLSSAREQCLKLVLSCLEGRPQGAVSLCTRLEQEYGLSIEPATFLRALAEFTQRGWIEVCRDEQSQSFYGLTTAGEIILSQHRTALQRRGERIGVTDPALFRKEKSMKPTLWVMWLLHLYPSAWRERYEQEMVALLERHTITLATLLDLLLGALDAHLDPAYRTAKPFPWFKDVRSIAITFVCAFAIFVFALFNWSSLHLLPAFQRAADLYGSLDSFGNLVGLLALLASNLLMIGMLVKEEKEGQKKHLLRPAVYCLALLFVLPLFLVGPRTELGFPAFPRIIFLEMVPMPDLPSVYLENLLHLFPFLGVLLSSLFIALVVGKKTTIHPRKSALRLAVVLCLILPLSSSLGFLSYFLLPIGAINLVESLVYFGIGVLPYFVWLATVIGVLSRSEVSRHMGRFALVPACALAFAMLLDLITALITFPASLRSIYSFSELVNEVWHWSSSTHIIMLAINILAMVIAASIALTALVRGFIALNTPASPASLPASQVPIQARQQSW